MKGRPIHVEHPVNSYARIGGLQELYFELTEKAYINAIKLEKQPHDSLTEEQKYKLDREQTGYAVESIVFAAMAAEAAINNYAGIHLSDSYRDHHLNGLDVLSKWVIIPRLACGREFDKSGPAYSSLKRLIKSRNKLVHNKSKKFNPNAPELAERISEDNRGFVEDFYNSLRALYLLAMEMDYLLGQAHNPIGTLDPAFRVCKEIHPLVKPLFNECKKLIIERYNQSVE